VRAGQLRVQVDRAAERGLGGGVVARLQVDDADVFVGEAVGLIDLEQALERPERIGTPAGRDVRVTQRDQRVRVVVLERLEETDRAIGAPWPQYGPSLIFTSLCVTPFRSASSSVAIAAAASPLRQ
jgi:hypothetical protein